MTIVHSTPGLLDLRAITTMGLSAKPSTANPIGMFGTGLKYSIATLMRVGAAVTLYIGLDRYEFATSTDDFRGTPFNRLRVRQLRHGLVKARWIDLPYTTEYGKFWEPWMVFREMHSNTLDEGGSTYPVDVPNNLDDLAMPNTTTFIITLPEYDEAWDQRDEIFLPNGVRSEGFNKIQVIKTETNNLYFRSLRVYKTDKPMLFTWNLLADMALTEDRTLASEYLARYEIACFILSSDDEDLIERVVTVSKDYWEHDLDWPTYLKPSAAFRAVMNRNPQYTNAYLPGYYERYAERPPQDANTIWKRHTQPWKVTTDAIYDAKGIRILDKPYSYGSDFVSFANTLVSMVAERKLEKLGVYDWVAHPSVVPKD